MLAVFVAILIAYPFSMSFAHRAASFVFRKISHEAVISTFIGLALVVGIWEGGLLGVLVVVTIGLIGGFPRTLSWGSTSACSSWVTTRRY